MSGGILTFEIVLNRISKNICLSLAVGTGVLLGADDNGLGAVTSVNPVDHFIQAVHLLNLFGVDVEEVLLQRTAGGYAHHDNASAFIVDALYKNLVEHIGCCFYYGGGRIGRSNQSGLIVFPVLQQVLAEGVAAYEYAHNGGYCILPSQLLGTSGGIVGNVGSEGVLIGYHAVETP